MGCYRVLRTLKIVRFHWILDITEIGRIVTESRSDNPYQVEMYDKFLELEIIFVAL